MSICRVYEFVVINGAICGHIGKRLCFSWFEGLKGQLEYIGAVSDIG